MTVIAVLSAAEAVRLTIENCIWVGSTMQVEAL